MLSDDAFLRRLPRVVDRKQAILLEALVFASDSAALALQQIINAAAASGKEILSTAPIVRTGMIAAAWSIVDSLHAIRQILRALDPKAPRVAAFLEQYEVVRTLRNKMDHLVSNAGNWAGASPTSPLFGAISYLHVSPDMLRKEADGTVKMDRGGLVLISSGRTLGGEKMGVVNPLGSPVSLPISHVQLEAFGTRLVLDEAVASLKEVLEELDAGFEKGFRLKTDELQKSGVLSNEQVQDFGAVGTCAYLEVEFSTQE